MILRNLADARAGTLQEAGEMAPRADAEPYQNERDEERQQGLFAGQHHHAGLTELAHGIERDQTA